MQRIAIAFALLIVFSGCSAENASTVRLVTAQNGSAEKNSADRQGCRSKPNFEGMMRTLCY
jgi:PBP1b-binding outer membrane lipoprotein LpoB